MIRVGFVLNFADRSWLGGINYFSNLLAALGSLPEPRVEAVVLAGPSADPSILNLFQAREQIISKWCDVGGWRWKVRRVATLGSGRDAIFERLLNRAGVQLLSHSGYLGRRSKLPSLAWIPDFQERYLPTFFSEEQRAARARELIRVCHHASALLLSSETARTHLFEIDPAAAQRAHVLPFAVTVPPLDIVPTQRDLQARYQLPERYFFLPNQFWAHKNHDVVIDALSICKDARQPVNVVATGNARDHRDPGHFGRIIERAGKLGVSEYFRPLGTVPYHDLIGLLLHSLALVNPSRFEGWSTTVEEARALGKRAILSDIPVHREQNPPASDYFSPDDPQALAELFLEHSSYDLEAGRRASLDALRQHPTRIASFGRSYEDVVINVLAQGNQNCG